MATVKPLYSKSEVNRAGEMLASATLDADPDYALEILANWRAAHAYPMNTFQATLRKKLRRIDKTAIIAQRLKRTPSIVLKLQRFGNMKLARIQDIGGLRGVVKSISQVRQLESAYRTAKFPHELSHSKDYIKSPKFDGYRGIHLVYRYLNSKAPEFNGLCVELQFRTRLQHAWATAVETASIFLGQALKSGEGEQNWKQFFALASAAFAVQEKSPLVPGFEHCSEQELIRQIQLLGDEIGIFDKLAGFAVAANSITGKKGSDGYNIILLNRDERTVLIKPYSKNALEVANREYAELELKHKADQSVDIVLVSAGPIKSLRKAYPNYFLDTHQFMVALEKQIGRKEKPRRAI